MEIAVSRINIFTFFMQNEKNIIDVINPQDWRIYTLEKDKISIIFA
jgi:hypothetical protein